MTKSLLQQIMVKQEKPPVHSIDVAGLTEKIQSGYTVNRIDKQTQKKTFAPSTLAYGHGECPRYWYLAFDGQMFEDDATPYSAANMTAGTKSHERIQEAMGNIPEFLVDSEFKITNNDPPIFGYGDVIVNWQGEELLGEIKTMMNEGFEYRKAHMKPKTGHLVQLLIYMKILKKPKAVLIYENKNNHELLTLPVQVNNEYRKWIDYSFDWMRQVRKAWVDREIPVKTYRSNSKICKGCPIQKACAEADVGVLKIKPLEGLSETL